MLRIFLNVSYISVFLFTAFITAPIAQANDQANTNMGDFEVGGSFSINHYRTTNSNSDSTTSVTLYAPIQFFIINSLSVGGAFSFLHYSGIGQYSFGPAATYYFANSGRLTGYVGASVLFSILDEELGTADYRTYAGRLGMKYFITRSIALGPEVGFEHQDINNSNRDYQHAYAAVQFSIHL